MWQYTAAAAAEAAGALQGVLQDKMPLDKMPPTVEFVFIFF